MSKRGRMTDRKDVPQVSISLKDMSWNKTGNWTFYAPVYRDKVSPCILDCPLQVPVGRYLRLVREELPRGLEYTGGSQSTARGHRAGLLPHLRAALQQEGDG